VYDCIPDKSNFFLTLAVTNLQAQLKSFFLYKYEFAMTSVSHDELPMYTGDTAVKKDM
jgi:hypothetical protein